MAEEATSAASAAGATEFADAGFADLLQKEFRPRTDHAKSAVESAVKTLAQQALSNTALISDDVLHSIAAMIAEIDKKLSTTTAEAANATMANNTLRSAEFP